MSEEESPAPDASISPDDLPDAGKTSIMKGSQTEEEESEEE